MEIIDYNGEGRWSHVEIEARYRRYAAEARIIPRDLAPMESSNPVWRWVYPVMNRVIEGIEAGDPACIRIGIEFIEENGKFPFGKTLKAKTARTLRRASLSNLRKSQIRRRVFGMLRAGHIPHEYREYAKLVRRIGFDASEVPEVDPTNFFAARFRKYFEMAKRSDG